MAKISEKKIKARVSVGEIKKKKLKERLDFIRNNLKEQGVKLKKKEVENISKLALYLMSFLEDFSDINIELEEKTLDLWVILEKSPIEIKIGGPPIIGFAFILPSDSYNARNNNVEELLKKDIIILIKKLSRYLQI